MNNTDLIKAAAAAYQTSVEEMTLTYNELSDLLDDDEKKELEEVQKVWSEFAEKQAGFSSGLMRGGTGERLLYLEEINSLVTSRLSSLKVAIRERSAA